MQSEPTILGFDTSAAHCAAALLKDDKNISTVFTEMQKGQVESLIPILETLLKNESTTWDNLNAIGVGIGPGNFTGIRISVSAARGLALSLRIPAIGVSNFDVMHSVNQSYCQGNDIKIISLKGPGDTAYIQVYKEKMVLYKSTQIFLNKPNIDFFSKQSAIVVGYKAKHLSKEIGCDYVEKCLTDIPQTIVELSKKRLLDGLKTDERPSPLYIKSADASPQSTVLPNILK